MDSIHNISKVFLTYDDCQDINAHQNLIDIIKLYIDHIAVHLNASKERLLEEYKKRYELEEMPTARVTRPQDTATSAVSPHAQPALIENFVERARRLFNERDAAAVSIDNTAIAVSARPATRELPTQPDSFIDAAVYIKLKTTLEVIFVSGWGDFILQYQFNELDDRMSKLKKG